MDTRFRERSGLGSFGWSIPGRSHSLARSDRGDSGRDSRWSTAAPRGAGRRRGQPHHGVAGGLFWGTNPQLVAAAARKQARRLGRGRRYRARGKDVPTGEDRKRHERLGTEQLVTVVGAGRG